jgi:hypothetical protein
MLLVLALTFFFVRDGSGMVRSAFSLLPPRRRRLAFAASDRAWRTLSQWVRGTVLVALIDAVGIGVGLMVLGVPLALPLALLTFLGAFVPVIGALVAGVVAVLVAWATVGTRDALITLGIVLAVQQVEGNILQPMVMGRVLPLHPAVLLLAVTAGAVVGGVAGAFVAVPLLATVTAGTQAFLAEGRKLRARAGAAGDTGRPGRGPGHRGARGALSAPQGRARMAHGLGEEAPLVDEQHGLGLHHPVQPGHAHRRPGGHRGEHRAGPLRSPAEEIPGVFVLRQARVDGLGAP